MLLILEAETIRIHNLQIFMVDKSSKANNAIITCVFNREKKIYLINDEISH